MWAADLRKIIFTKIPGNIRKFDRLCRVAGRDGESTFVNVVVDPMLAFHDRNRAQAVQCSLAAIRTVVNDVFHRRKERFPAGLHSLILDGRLVLGLDIHDPDLSFVFSLLESELGYIKMLGRQYASCQFEIMPGHDSFIKADRTPTGLAIVKHSAQLPESGLLDLDFIRAARSEGLPHFLELTAKMNTLQSLGHIRVYPRKSLLIFRLDRVPNPGAETEAVAGWLHKKLLERYEATELERRQLLDILLGNSCISAAIASHFGAQLSEGKVRCGQCSFCLDGKPAKTRSFDHEQVTVDKVQSLLDEIPTRDDPRFLARVAIGVHSPRVRQERLHLRPVFRSMAACRFEVRYYLGDESHMVKWESS